MSTRAPQAQTLVPSPPGGTSEPDLSLRPEDLVSSEGIGPPDPAGKPAATGRSPSALSRAALAPHAGGLERTYESISELGRGGVGVVNLARHRLLDREVAIKSVNPQTRRTVSRRSLLREAAAVAALEHPNIVPAYDVVVDLLGEPHIVLRRIEGRTWLEYLLLPSAITTDFNARDLLGWHLGILEQICNAIQHAHSRGVLHRDIKPDNVMIGLHGEVYVLDWGLAVRFNDQGPARLPLAHDDRRIVGTPRYMSPEMALGDGPRLGPHTDVYLLGGLLYAVLSGRGPHPGATAAETLANVPRFTPQIPDTAPERLVEIVAKAMAAEPADRYPTVDALKHALVTFREQRQALDLAHEAGERLRALDEALTAETIDRQAVYRSFGAARFGYQQALRAWPGLAEAETGLSAAFIRMVRYELGAGDPRAASVLLDQMTHPPDDLVARRALLVASQRAAAEAEARERADRDPTLGQRTRIFVFSVVMVTWAVLPMVAWATGATLSHPSLLKLHGGALIAVIGLVVWARESLQRTVLNRRVTSLLIILQSTLLASDLLGNVLGFSAHGIVIWHKLFFAALAAIAAESIDRRFIWAVPTYLATVIISVWQPELVMPTNALANAIVAAIGFSVWAPAARGRLFVRPPNE